MCLVSNFRLSKCSLVIVHFVPTTEYSNPLKMNTGKFSEFPRFFHWNFFILLSENYIICRIEHNLEHAIKAGLYVRGWRVQQQPEQWARKNSEFSENFLLCLEKIFPISLNETIYGKEKLVKIVKQKINQFHGWFYLRETRNLSRKEKVHSMPKQKPFLLIICMRHGKDIHFHFQHFHNHIFPLLRPISPHSSFNCSVSVEFLWAVFVT